MYGNDKHTAIVLSLLKAYGIRKIVISPGFCNVHVSAGVSYDPFFEVYSVVDERSAAYFATGLSVRSGEPVVISCTGATASRNYLPALTEAYYRGIPIIALTAQRRPTDLGSFLDQTLDRTVSQNDVKLCSVILPAVKDAKDEEQCILSVNKALLTAIYQRGPVHIDIPIHSWSFTREQLPQLTKMGYYTAEDFLLHKKALPELRKQLAGQKIAVFIGSHNRFDEDTARALDCFAEQYDTAVFYDHTSNYHGKNAVLAAIAGEVACLKNKPEIVIDLGGVTGAYSAPDVLTGAKEFWRISEDRGFHCRYGKTDIRHFIMSEYCFFKTMGEQTAEYRPKSGYYSQICSELRMVVIPELPLSNVYVCQELSSRLPSGSVLSLGIMNSLRSMNYFQLKHSIDTVANVGGFGIDGTLSTMIGQSMAEPERLFFSILGDLAFFYDMNALGIHHIRNNLRFLVVNNGCGVEMTLNAIINRQIGLGGQSVASAYGHFGSAKAWAEDMGFHYLCAKSKEEFLAQVDSFCSGDLNHFGDPVLFEVFVSDEEDRKAISLMRTVNQSAYMEKTENNRNDIK